MAKADLVRLLSNDIVLYTLTPYLSLPALGNLALTCSSFNELLFMRPGAIHELDLAFCSSKTVAKVLSLPVVKEGLRALFLDSCFVDDALLTSLFTEYRLRHLSLSASYGWSLEHLCELVKKYYITPLPVCAAPLVEWERSQNDSGYSSAQSGYSSPITEYDDEYSKCCIPMCPQRPSIKSLGLLGGPSFPTTSISATAPLFVNLASQAGIKTDLKECESQHHVEASSSGWFLAESYPRECNACGCAEEKLCLRCLVLRSCRGCQKFWCSKCDPSVTRTRLDCYDCGPACEDCKIGIANYCKFCKAKYCRIHQEGSTDEYCDWCSSRGGRSRHFF